jgi:hypothetical protein
MRILIDECLSWRTGRALTGHCAVSAQKMGGYIIFRHVTAVNTK